MEEEKSSYLMQIDEDQRKERENAPQISMERLKELLEEFSDEVMLEVEL